MANLQLSIPSPPSTMVAPFLALFLFRFVAAVAMDSLTPSQSLADGSTLVSRNGTFEVGFFSPGVSKNRYFGIWFKNLQVPTFVWVANRNNPINDSSGILFMNSTGHILLLSHNFTVVWSARLLRQVSNPKLQLLDTGNLVLRDEEREDENSDNFSWQSFDYPTDTFLPGMKLGVDLRNHIERSLTAWKNPNDPSTGDLTLKMEHLEYAEPVMWKNSQKYVRFGPWNGLRFSGKPRIQIANLVPKFVSSKDEISFQYFVQDKSMTIMVVLNQSTNTRNFYLWSADKQNWVVFMATPRDDCDYYAVCGGNGYCDINNSPSCKCLKGFKPKSPDNWEALEYREGCERNKPIINCSSDAVEFAKFSQMKLPDPRVSWVNKSMNLEECREKCLRNCSCMAYANTDISGSGSGCVIWMGDLFDLKLIPDAGQDLYVKLLASELENAKLHPKMAIRVGIGAATALILLAILLISFFYYKKRSTLKDDDKERGESREDLELPLFELSVINKATDNFSADNKLGEGGFGPVYKGRLENGQEIAVKRLAKSSGQGLNEFKNEIILIAKLQHRNLVKLLGCCIHGEENMLIYEYMPNKSLDFFIFDQMRRKLLNWSCRFHIICGIARGLVYLHQDSRLRIIHRDLKASNVLLDINMIPKISDFGVAKTCGGDETEGNTRRVVGTCGYMAPEYAIDGQFSVKSDVFSFGILVLEILSGKRSRGFYQLSDHNLTEYAWRLWEEGNLEELTDDMIKETYNSSEVIRCIHISLLCVQKHPDDRPTMSSVVMMLGCEISLPQPKPPGFFTEKATKVMNYYCDQIIDYSTSTNELTHTTLDPR